MNEAVVKDNPRRAASKCAATKPKRETEVEDEEDPSADNEREARV
jgi:hypothetical protein